MGGMDPRGLLRGKAVIITGGEGSIGMATARAFVAEGAQVCLIGLLADELRVGAQALGGAATWAVGGRDRFGPGQDRGGGRGRDVRPA